MKKIIDFIDAENWYNENKENILLEHVSNDNKTSHYFEFDDVVDEVEQANQVLSDEGKRNEIDDLFTSPWRFALSRRPNVANRHEQSHPSRPFKSPCLGT